MIHGGIFCFLIILKVKPVAEPAGSRATWVFQFLFVVHLLPLPSISSPLAPPPPVPVLYTAYKGTTSAAGIRRRRPALLSESPPRLSLSAELRGYFYTVKRLELASFHCPRLELPFSVCTYIDAPTCARAPTRHRPAHGSEDSPLLYRLITNGRWTLSTIYERESREGRGR